MKRARKPLTPQQCQEVKVLRAKAKTLTAAGLHASAKMVRRKLRALLGNYELEHP